MGHRSTSCLTGIVCTDACCLLHEALDAFNPQDQCFAGVYDDWMLAIRKLRQASNGKIQKAMMIDLDVHQVHTPPIRWHYSSTLGCQS